MSIGIYKITSPSGKVYVGQSVNIDKRFLRYKGIRKEDKQHKIYNSLKKYGFDSHKFEIIEECSIKQLNEREQLYKKYYLNLVGWDWSKVLFCGLYDSGGGPKSEQTRLKISKAKKGKKCSIETLIKMSKVKKGKPVEALRKPRKKGTGENISKSKLGKKQPNISKAKKGKPVEALRKPILQCDLEGNFIKEWSGQNEAMFQTKIYGVTATLSGKQKTSGGFKWKYKNK